MMEGLKQLMYYPLLAFMATFNEFFKATKLSLSGESLEKITDDIISHDLKAIIVDFISELSNYLSWKEVTLEAVVFPIMGLFTIKLVGKLKRKKTVEELRDIIDEANEELKKHEKTN